MVRFEIFLHKDVQQADNINHNEKYVNNIIHRPSLLKLAGKEQKKSMWLAFI